MCGQIGDCALAGPPLVTGSATGSRLRIPCVCTSHYLIRFDATVLKFIAPEYYFFTSAENHAVTRHGSVPGKATAVVNHLQFDVCRACTVGVVNWRAIVDIKCFSPASITYCA